MEQEVIEADIVLPTHLSFKKVQMYEKYPKGQARGRHWKHLKQIIQAENYQNYPPDESNYVNIESPPSMHPCKRICDITGYEAPYYDPRTNLRYANADVFKLIRSLPNEYACSRKEFIPSVVLPLCLTFESSLVSKLKKGVARHSNPKSGVHPNMVGDTTNCAGFSHQQLGRSLSQKDLSKNHDGNQLFALSDDEARDGHSSKNMIEKTIRAVYMQEKAEHPSGDDVNSGLYEAMRKELRYAVDEIRMELEQAMDRKTSNDSLSYD
ncbi:unnamed protein product [Camellia sinensis]